MYNPITKKTYQCGAKFCCKQSNTTTLHYHLRAKHTSIAPAIEKARTEQKRIQEKDAEKLQEALDESANYEAYEHGMLYCN